MSDKEKGIHFNVGDTVGWIVMLLLVVFCAGSPDLLDAIVAWVGRQP